jgi:hypothetical protein
VFRGLVSLSAFGLHFLVAFLFDHLGLGEDFRNETIPKLSSFLASMEENLLLFRGANRALLFKSDGWKTEKSSCKNLEEDNIQLSSSNSEEQAPFSGSEQQQIL